MNNFLKLWQQIALISGIGLIVYLILQRMKIVPAIDLGMNKNVKAFLWMIRKCEGTANEKGYNTLFGYEYFSDMSKHPNKVICKGGYCSTAAGAYQILYKTWTTVILKRIALPDFSQKSQDLAAIELLKVRGAYEDVKAGRFESAVQKCAKEWASLPGSPYGQPTRTLAQAKGYYKEAGGQLT